MNIEIIHNVKASRGKSYTIQQLNSLFKEYTTDFHISVATGADILDAASHAKASKPDVIVVCGGDGSVSAVAGELAGTDIKLGILPAGTFNNFARSADIPLAMQEAVQVIFRGQSRAIDIGKVNGKIFINNSSIGLYPKVVRVREKILIHWGGSKIVAMAIAFLTLFKRFPILSIEFEIEGKTIQRKSPFVFIGNNEYEMNLLNIGSRKSLQGGKLSLYTGNFESRRSILQIIIFILFNRLRQNRDFDYHTARKIRLETRKKYTHVSLDGEIYEMQSPLFYEIQPKQLQIIMPNNTKE